MYYKIVSSIIDYYLVGTFFLLNIAFNPSIKLEYINKKTKESKEVPPIIIVGICFYWIIMIPFIIIKSRRINDE